MVGVLVLVDEHVPEAAPVGLAHLRERLEQVHRGHDQVVEVERVGVAQAALVHRVGLGVGLLEVVLRVLLRVLVVDQLVLLVGDPVEDRARRVALDVEVEVARDQRHQPLGVGRVVDRERRLVAELVDLLAQDPHAGGVERRDPHDPGPPADELLDPLAHLGGGLVGERDRQDRAGVGVALRDQPGDPPGQHPGLARAGSGDDEQRRPGVRHGPALRLVEAVEQLVGRGDASALRRHVELGLGGGGSRGLRDGEQRAHVPPSLRAEADSAAPGPRPGRGWGPRLRSADERARKRWPWPRRRTAPRRPAPGSRW